MMAKKSLMKVLDNPVEATLAELLNASIDAAEKIRKLRAVNRVLRAELENYEYKGVRAALKKPPRSEEHTSELQSR